MYMDVYGHFMYNKFWDMARVSTKAGFFSVDEKLGTR